MAKIGESIPMDDPKRGRKIAEAAIVWANTYNWKGKAGRTDKACFLIHAKIARKSNQEVYELSAVYLAKLANIPHGTAKDSSKRLREAGFIEMVENLCRYSGRGALWRISVDIPDQAEGEKEA